jgi:hypothetical protein
MGTRGLEEIVSEVASMKALIAVVVVLLWLFFPVQWLVRLRRRRRAIREADKYAKTLFR